MRGTVKIGDKELTMVANGATPFLFKRVFHKDFLVAAQKKDKDGDTDMDVYAQLGYIMAMQAEKPLADLVNALTADDFLTWIEGFEAMDLVSVAPEIFALYQAQAVPSSRAKKKR